MQTSQWNRRNVEDAVGQQYAPRLCFTDPRNTEYGGIRRYWGLMKTITARYRQSVENHQKESLQDLHQHQNLTMNLS